MNAGGPICSASRYMPRYAIWIATRSEIIRSRTRPRTSRPGRCWTADPVAFATRPPASPSVSAVRDASAAPPSRRQLLTRAHEIVDVRVSARLGAVGHAELAIGVGQVELDRLLGHPELPRDRAVGLPLGDQPQDLELPLRERA